MRARTIKFGCLLRLNAAANTTYHSRCSSSTHARVSLAAAHISPRWSYNIVLSIWPKFAIKMCQQNDGPSTMPTRPPRPLGQSRKLLLSRIQPRLDSAIHSTRHRAHYGAGLARFSNFNSNAQMLVPNNSSSQIPITIILTQLSISFISHLFHLYQNQFKLFITQYKMKRFSRLFFS